jgi:hypothetical protein
MRIPFGLLGASTAVVLAVQGVAQEANEQRVYQSGDLSFALPATWRTSSLPATVTTGVIFTADGGSAGRFTVARLPISAAAKVDALNDPMNGPETVDLRIALEEAGLTPVAGVLKATLLGETKIESVSYRCKAAQGPDQQVLMSTMRNAKEVLRARLQIPDAEATPIVDKLLASLSYGKRPTFGLAKLHSNPKGPSSSVASATGTPAAAIPVITTPPTVAAPSAGETMPKAGDMGRIVQDSRGSLVFVEGGGGAGSGFVCRMKEGVFLLTNQHVMAGMNAARFTRLDSTPITAGGGTAAVGHDLIRFALQAETNPLTAMYDIEKEVRIGDDIVVLGNSEGARVIQPLEGKLIGIGPDRIEVTAQFVPGNSGSPIVHVASGKVIGIATYLIQRRFTELTDGTEAKVRRFGFRLDSAKQWQPLNWQVFQQDKATMDRVESGTQDLMRVIKDLKGDQWPNPADYTTSTLARAVRDLNSLAGRQGISKADRTRAFTGFFASVRSATQGDVAQARQTLRYDYFQRALNDEMQVREEMFRLFDRIVKAR